MDFFYFLFYRVGYKVYTNINRYLKQLCILSTMECKASDENVYNDLFVLNKCYRALRMEIFIGCLLGKHKGMQ